MGDLIVNFKPWIGRRYGKSPSMFPFKLLVLTHSHPHQLHDRKSDFTPTFTRKFISGVVAGGGGQFTSRIRLLMQNALPLTRRLDIDEDLLFDREAFRKAFFESIAYAVAIPTVLKKAPSGGRARSPKSEEWSRMEKRLPYLVAATKPDGILCLGKSVYDEIQKRMDGKSERLSVRNPGRSSAREIKDFPNLFHLKGTGSRKSLVYGAMHPSGGLRYTNGTGSAPLVAAFLDRLAR